HDVRPINVVHYTRSASCRARLRGDRGHERWADRRAGRHNRHLYCAETRLHQGSSCCRAWAGMAQKRIVTLADLQVAVVAPMSCYVTRTRSPALLELQCSSWSLQELADEAFRYLLKNIGGGDIERKFE